MRDATHSSGIWRPGLHAQALKPAGAAKRLGPIFLTIAVRTHPSGKVIISVCVAVTAAIPQLEVVDDSWISAETCVW